MRRRRGGLTPNAIACACALAAGACEFHIPEPEGPLGGSRTLNGTVVDFESNQAIPGVATISTTGLAVVPTITSQGASFTLTGVPDHSVFQVLVAVPPSHRPTFSDAVIVETDDLHELRLPAVREAFLASLATGFGVTPSAA